MLISFLNHLPWNAPPVKHRTEAESDFRQFFVVRLMIFITVSGRCSSLKNERIQIG